MIRREDGKFVLYTQDGRRKLGTFDTEEKAKRRERQIVYWRGKDKPS